MRFTPRALRVSLGSLLAIGLVIAACTDGGDPLLPGPPMGPIPTLAAVTCTARISTRVVRCGDSEQDWTGANRTKLIIGGQNVYVRLTSSNVAYNSATERFSFDVTVRNLTRQPFGTADQDSLLPHPEGVRVFFHSGPNTLGGTGVNSVANPTGIGTFTGPGQPYFQYDSVNLGGTPVRSPILRLDTSTPKHWELAVPATVDSMGFVLYVSSEVPFPNGWTDAVQDSTIVVRTMADTVIMSTTDSVQLIGTARDRVGRANGPPVGFVSSNPAAATVTPAGMVHGAGAGVATVTATAGALPAFRRTVFIVNNPSNLLPDSASALVNVTRTVAAADGVLANDTDPENNLSVVPGTVTTAGGGTAVLSADGSFSYISDAGEAAARDSFQYHTTDGVYADSAWVVMRLENRGLWYVKADAAAGGTGTDQAPFQSVGGAQGAAAASDTILVMLSSAALDEHVSLPNGQRLIGAGVLGDMTYTLADSAIVTVLTAGTAPELATSSPGIAIVVGQNNHVRGLSVSTTAGAALLGSAFGTLTLGRLSLNATGGPGLSLSTGTLAAATLAEVSSSGSATSGIDLTGVAGTLLVESGTLTGAAQATVSIVGGSVALTYQGNVSQGNNAALVAVTGGHTGELIFNTGTLSATAGSGIQLSNANGSYDFGGPTLNGGDAGIDVTAGSAGTVVFGAGASVTNPTGIAVNISSPGAGIAFTYSGSISTSASAPVLVSGLSGGTVMFDGGITSTGQGITVQTSSGGSVSFNGASKSLSTGANPAVSLTNNPGTAIFFGGGGLAITTTAASGFVATGGGTVQVTGANNTVNATGGTGVSLDGIVSGVSGITFRTVTASSGVNGIRLNGVTGTGFSVTGDGATAASGGLISSGSGDGVSLTSVAGLTQLKFMNVSTATSAKASVRGTTFGTLEMQTVSLSATGGPALDLNDGTISSSALSQLASSGSTTSAVLLTGVAGSFTAAAGTLSGAAGAAVSVVGGSVAFTFSGNVSQANSAALLSVSGGHSAGTLTFNTGTLSATNGTGLQFPDADGTYTFAGTTTLAGGDAGIDIGSLSSGTVNVSSGAITSPTGIAIAIVGGSADLNYSGNVTQANAQPLLSVSAGHSGDVSFAAGTLSATNGTGLQFDNADGTYAFTGTVVLNGGDAGIDVGNGSAGTFTFPATASITNPSGSLVSIQNSAPSFTYSGAFTKVNNSVVGLLVSNNTGGTIAFNGSGVTKSISSGTAAAVSLSSNSGATINFSGGSLALTSGTGAGLTATGGGTLNVTGANNTLSAAGGTALNVQNTTIGASGLSFRSISANGGANGIVLQNTGNTNGMQVTGDGATNGSGGTISNTSGGDGAVAGNGIYLNAVRNVTLSWMALSGHANNGLYGTGVRGLTVNRVRFTGNNGSSNSGTFDESAVQLVDAGGAMKFTGSRFDGGAFNAVRVENVAGTAPTLDSLVFENDTVESMQGSTADVRSTALLVSLTDGTADTRIRNNRITAWWGNAIHVLVQGTASGTTRITGNRVENLNGALAGAGGIWVAGGNHAYNISGNTVLRTNGTAISADRVAAGSNMNGTIDGNAVGQAGVANSGSFTGIGIFASHHGPGTTTVKISGNVLRQINGSADGAITTRTGDALAYGGSGTMNATVVGNNIQESGTTVNAAQSAILVTHGIQSGPPNDTDQGCYDVGGAGAAANNISNFNTASGAGRQNLIRVNQRFGTTSRWPGYTGAATGLTSQSDMAAYLLARNTASNSINTNTSTGGFLNTVPAGSACPQPSI